MIELKNIDLSKVSFIKQANKFSEEEKEFTEAVSDCWRYGLTEKNKDHMVEEFYDMVQAGLGVIQKIGVNVEEVEKYYPLHLEKIKNRPRRKASVANKEFEDAVNDMVKDNWYMQRFNEKK